MSGVLVFLREYISQHFVMPTILADAGMGYFRFLTSAGRQVTERTGVYQAMVIVPLTDDR
jgi:hypothetical protein